MHNYPLNYFLPPSPERLIPFLIDLKIHCFQMQLLKNILPPRIISIWKTEPHLYLFLFGKNNENRNAHFSIISIMLEGCPFI